ncbi:MAG: carbamoyl phosphate synthase large subunit [Planctomycetota bacterium]|nr:MAG: carbamoyl phosphate synthase large subunit [Planctomycetota bacterium]
MPKRSDISKILIIGSGPIIIGQACEFDYSGTQACKALKEEGYTVILVNSNPATIMTDPNISDRTYIEPVTPEYVEKVIEKERPDCILPTLGGQTGLNVAVELHHRGVLEKYNVELIGANFEAINKTEQRSLFKEAMIKIGLDVPESGLANNKSDCEKILKEIGLPVIIRPSYTLGGTGGGIANTEDEFWKICFNGLDLSTTSEILIEESLVGWKEYELEVMRDKNDNVVIICSIENLDPMGVHTGDSITVAPAQTLTDKEYQYMRDSAIKIIREMGVETGGSNIQFSTDPKTGRQIVIEMNPRVSRSSALASKATGFPIAKIAAKLAIGYTLDEIKNDITGETLASFEPSIDYCVVKIPRFTFEKFKGSDTTLNSVMKSVGEVMAIGRTFREAFHKGLRSLETGLKGFDEEYKLKSDYNVEINRPSPDRILYIKKALEDGKSIDYLFEKTGIDPWFLQNFTDMIIVENKLKSVGLELDNELLYHAKREGLSDELISKFTGIDSLEIRKRRLEYGIIPVYKLVDTCAAEFAAKTPYYYSTYEQENEAVLSNKEKVIVLGGGPNRIGQGIEFDYCCVQAVFGIQDLGMEAIMVNSNPETVSTDYDTSDKLYFEPLTFEDVMNIIDQEKPKGVIVQLGGQTPLNLCDKLFDAGVTILGTQPDSIAKAEDRSLMKQMVDNMNLIQPESGIAYTYEEAVVVAKEIGYPVLIRPSFVLGGRAMEIVYQEKDLKEFMQIAVEASPNNPILIDKYLEDAIELDVDAICDGKDVVIGGILEHIEQAGIHSGDSASVLPPYSLSNKQIDRIKIQAKQLALELNVIGLLNIQFAIKNDIIYIIEVNPRASRTVPFISKATGVPLARLAAKVMCGKSLKELNFTKEVSISHIAVKESVFPFDRFANVDAVLGPEMRSTGEVMGIDKTFGKAFAKSQLGANQKLKPQGNAFISVNYNHKRDIIFIVKKLSELDYKIYATPGTAKALKLNGIDVKEVEKISDDPNNNLLTLMNENKIKIDLIINTPSVKANIDDEKQIRIAAIENRIPLVTTIFGAMSTVAAIEAIKLGDIGVTPIQEYIK